MLEPEVTLGDRYVLVDLVARGGMGEVWRARDTVLERFVALKVLLPDLAGDPGFAARFQAEARAMAALSHPGIVEIYDYGQTRGLAYLVMQFVGGESLVSLIRRAAPLAPGYAMRLVAQAAEAIEAAHRQGIVHRDVKPANLLLRTDGRVALTDFGIARIVASDRLTAAGEFLGTASYLAPEQVTGAEIGPTTDVYALGVVAYELLTGGRPFSGDTPYTIAAQHVHEPPPPLPASVPAPVRAVVERALAKDPGLRWPSAAALAAAATSAGGATAAATASLAEGAMTVVEEPTGTTVDRSHDTGAGFTSGHRHSPEIGSGSGFSTGHRYPYETGSGTGSTSGHDRSPGSETDSGFTTGHRRSHDNGSSDGHRRSHDTGAGAGSRAGAGSAATGHRRPHKTGTGTGTGIGTGTGTGTGTGFISGHRRSWIAGAAAAAATATILFLTLLPRGGGDDPQAADSSPSPAPSGSATAAEPGPAASPSPGAPSATVSRPATPGPANTGTAMPPVQPTTAGPGGQGGPTTGAPATTRTVPPMYGWKENEVRAEMTRLNLTVSITYESTSDQCYAIRQSPVAGTVVQSGSTVAVVIARARDICKEV